MREKLKILKFFLNLVKNMQANLFVIRGIYSIFKTFEMLLIMYIPSVIIMLLSKNLAYEVVIISILLGLILLLALRVVNQFLNLNGYIMENKFSQSLLRDVSNKIMSVPFSQIEDSEFVAKKEEALFPITSQNSIGETFRVIPTLLQATIMLVSVLTILLAYEPILMIMSVVLAGLSFALSRTLIKSEAKHALNSARQNKEYVYYLRVMRSPEIAKDARIYQMQPFFMDKLNNLFNIFVNISKDLYQTREYRALVNQILSVVLMGATYGYLIVKVMSSSISSAVFVLLVSATINFNQQINVFLSELLMLNKQLIYLKPLTEFYSLIENKEHVGEIVLVDKIVTVEFRNVYFRYPKTERDVIKGCSFKIEGSKNLSIVGQNGSGKTTIIKLLSRLYRPESGEILVNGRDIWEYEETSYLKHLSIIFQDFKTFAYSLKENIAFDNDFDEKKFNYAVEKSDLIRELDKFPKGVETKLANGEEEEETISLSKGQEQKLVIARSIYEDGSLLILDEPTASLDPIAEEEVYQNFQSVTKGKLAIFISHRLSSCRFSDNIIYMTDGRVSESGNHKELIEQNGDYAKLFNLQASKYK